MPARDDTLAALYARESERPLCVLVFLLPLLVAHEIGAALSATSAPALPHSVRAHSMLLSFFESLGVFGLLLPGLTLVSVLLAWHVLTRERWTLRPWVLAVMAAESLAWVLPLVVLGILVRAVFTPAAAIPEPLSVLDLPIAQRLTIALGAGLFEEMVFRLMLIAGLHLVLVDLARLPDSQGRVAAVLVSSVAFTLYHDLGDPQGGLSAQRAAFFFVAGLFFGTLYVLRGLGITAATHALYDILVLVILPLAADTP